MTSFTPFTATIGGILIGIAAVMMMALNGRIAGISGVLSGALVTGAGDRGWRVAFLLGLLAAPLITRLVTGAPPPFLLQAGTVQIVAAGLLVGFGTRLGSGCTSGHGVCGLSRLSPRSMLSVAVFMLAGIATVTAVRLLAGG